MNVLTPGTAVALLAAGFRLPVVRTATGVAFRARTAMAAGALKSGGCGVISDRGIEFYDRIPASVVFSVGLPYN